LKQPLKSTSLSKFDPDCATATVEDNNSSGAEDMEGQSEKHLSIDDNSDNE
jgi:hypothetical protein